MIVSQAKKHPRHPVGRCYKGRGSTIGMDHALAKARVNLALNLHLWVKARHMDFADLSRATGIAQSQLGRYRKLGKDGAFPGDEALDKISEALDLPVNYLLLDWDTLFDQTTVMLLPEFEDLKHTNVPNLIRAKKYPEAISLLSIMIKDQKMITKALAPASDEGRGKKKRG